MLYYFTPAYNLHKFTIMTLLHTQLLSSMCYSKRRNEKDD